MKNLKTKMSYALYAVLSFFLLSCGNDLAEKTVCNCVEKDKVIEWVGNHIKDANNMADEEMEDVIYRLEKTARGLICKERLYWCDNNWSIDWNDPRNKRDSCDTTY